MKEKEIWWKYFRSSKYFMEHWLRTLTNEKVNES